MELDLPTTSKSNEERSFECNDCGRVWIVELSLEVMASIDSTDDFILFNHLPIEI